MIEVSSKEPARETPYSPYRGALNATRKRFLDDMDLPVDQRVLLRTAANAVVDERFTNVDAVAAFFEDAIRGGYLQALPIFQTDHGTLRWQALATYILDHSTLYGRDLGPEMAADAITEDLASTDNWLYEENVQRVLARWIG